MKSPITLLAGIVLILGGLALGGTGAAHLIRPPAFEAVTRILIRNPPGGATGSDPNLIQHEVQTIESESVRENVIHGLNLEDVWGKKYNNGQRLSTADAAKTIRFDCRPVRNSDIVEIRAQSDDPAEAAALANEIVHSYSQVAEKGKSASVIVLMSALPSGAISPNRPLLMVIIAAGILMVIGGIVCLFDSTKMSEV